MFDNIVYSNSGLRPYQIFSKEQIYGAWKAGSRSVLLQMPTGTGKTRLFTSITREISNLSQIGDIKRVVIVAHKEELIQQISYTLSNHYNLTHGIIKAGVTPDYEIPIQVASVQTLRNRNYDKDVSLLIIDEAHHAIADSYKVLWDRFKNAWILGVTATPCRLDGSGLNQLFDSLVTSNTITSFIKHGYLCNFKYYGVKPDKIISKLSALKIKAGDYDENSLMEEFGITNEVKTKIVDSYKKYANGKKGIVYGINRKHAQWLTSIYREAGVSAEYIDSLTPSRQREKIVLDFRNGKFSVLCNVDIFSEGFDCPDIDFVQLARPTKSLTKYMQQVGRVLRVVDGKPYGIILDNVGAYLEHGLFDEERDWQEYYMGFPSTLKEKLVFKETSESNNVYEFQEGSDELFQLNEFIEDVNYESIEYSLYDFFDDLLKERFKAILTFGYSEGDVFNAIQVLHPLEFSEASNAFQIYNNAFEELQKMEGKLDQIKQSILLTKSRLDKYQIAINELIIDNLDEEAKIAFEGFLSIGYSSDKAIKVIEMLNQQGFKNAKEFAMRNIAQSEVLKYDNYFKQLGYEELQAKELEIQIKKKRQDILTLIEGRLKDLIKRNPQKAKVEVNKYKTDTPSIAKQVAVLPNDDELYLLLNRLYTAADVKGFLHQGERKYLLGLIGRVKLGLNSLDKTDRRTLRNLFLKAYTRGFEMSNKEKYEFIF
jgi:superfamily II DNA or RNA helicase